MPALPSRGEILLAIRISALRGNSKNPKGAAKFLQGDIEKRGPAGEGQALPCAASGRSALDVAVEAARRAGEIVRKGFGGTFWRASKGHGNIVTEIDVAADTTVRELVQKEFPGHSFLSEELAPEAVPRHAGCQWVVDPLDGTTNFAWGVPFFCVSVALVCDGAPVVAALYDPLRDELFTAVAGCGALLNGEPLSVPSAEAETDRAWLVSFDASSHPEMRRRACTLAVRLAPEAEAVRVLGSAALALAYVAAGRLDLHYHPSLNPWDVAAAALLVQEAGCAASDWAGRPQTIWRGEWVAGRPRAHRWFLERAREVPGIGET